MGAAQNSPAPRPATEGWQDRIKGNAVLAAGAGSLGGAVLSILQQAPMLPHAAATAVSCTVAVSLFSGLKEGVRALRCTDGAANSAVACAASSYLLVFLYKGRRAALPVAVWGGAAAGLLHAAGGWLQPAARLRRALVHADLLDDPELRTAMQHSHGGRRPGSAAELGWQRWLPIRQLTDEEWEAYQERKRDQFRQRVDAAQEGGLPMVLEERGRSAGGLGAAQDGSQESKPAG